MLPKAIDILVNTRSLTYRWFENTHLQDIKYSSFLLLFGFMGLGCQSPSSLLIRNCAQTIWHVFHKEACQRNLSVRPTIELFNMSLMTNKHHTFSLRACLLACLHTTTWRYAFSFSYVSWVMMLWCLLVYNANKLTYLSLPCKPHMITQQHTNKLQVDPRNNR